MKKKVENIEFIPYGSFEEIKSAIEKGDVSLGVRKDLAFECVRKGMFHSEKVIKSCTLLIYIPYVVWFSLFLFIVITGSWWLLLAVPVLAIGFFIFHPNMVWLEGSIKTILSFALVLLFALGVFYCIDWLWIISLVQIVTWQVMNRIYILAVNGIRERSLVKESIFCTLWQYGIISLHKKDGPKYFRSFVQYPDGSTKSYDEEFSSNGNYENVNEFGPDEVAEPSLDYFEDQELKKIIVEGIVYSLTLVETRDTVPLLVGYAINKLKFSSQDSIEFAFMTIALHNNSFKERNAICDKMIQDATKWSEGYCQADILIESAKLIIQKFQNTPQNQLSYSKIYLMCVIWLMQIQSETKEVNGRKLISFTFKNNIKFDFSDRIIATTHSWYNAERKVEIINLEYHKITLYYIEYLCNVISSKVEYFNFVDYLKNQEHLLSQDHKRQLIAGLYTILLENRPSSDEQLAYIPMVGEALSIDKETRIDIANKVLLIHKKNIN